MITKSSAPTTLLQPSTITRRAMIDSVAAAWSLCRKSATVRKFLAHMKSLGKAISRATFYRYIIKSKKAPADTDRPGRPRVHKMDKEATMLIEGLRQVYNKDSAEGRYAIYNRLRKVARALPLISLSTYKRRERESIMPVPSHESLRRKLRQKFGLSVRYDEEPVMRVLHTDDTTLSGLSWNGMKHADDWPHLLAFLDSGSRKILDHEILFHPPTHEDVLRIFKRIAHRYGLCSIMRCDNGSIFSRSLAFAESLMALAIKILPTHVATPQMNGKIERCFRSVKEGYLAKQSRWTRKLVHSQSGEKLEKAEARRLVNMFIKYYNSERPHSAIGMTPDAFFKKHYDKATRLVNHDQIDRAIMARSHEEKCEGNKKDKDIEITTLGILFRGARYNSPKLSTYQGTKVMLKFSPPADGEMPATIQVFKNLRKPVFIAEVPRLESLPMVCAERDEFNREANEVLDATENYLFESMQFASELEDRLMERTLMITMKRGAAAKQKKPVAAQPAKPAAKPRCATKIKSA